jgi:Zn-finger nucleic acid-binding protein
MRAERDTLKCDYCGNVVVPETDTSGVRVLAESPGREECPVCNVILMQASLGFEPLLYCAKCHGMLIAMMEFQSLMDAARTASGPVATFPADPHELDRVIQCPHCHRAMESHFYAGGGNVVMDTCETCCLHWLDHGELARIAKANATEANPIDNDPASFYDRAVDRQLDPALEVLDLLSRVLKPRM